MLPRMERLPGEMFQQDNARPHTATMSQDCLCHIKTLPRPVRSPNVSSIENIWDHLGWKIEQPTSLVELEARLQQL
ncbi:transposable element Tcb2 transposase [Trichonephila clavipes]|nr:transposable element Tcb2 transposase [Trichonephila clavipes]